MWIVMLFFDVAVGGLESLVGLVIMVSGPCLGVVGLLVRIVWILLMYLCLMFYQNLQ